MARYEIDQRLGWIQGLLGLWKRLAACPLCAFLQHPNRIPEIVFHRSHAYFTHTAVDAESFTDSEQSPSVGSF